MTPPMNDKNADIDLLRLAAKAADIALPETGYDQDMGFYIERQKGGWNWWNPLTDDGDALRLAVRCGLIVRGRQSKNQVYATVGDDAPFIFEPYESDEMAATRRTIVRAAASLASAEGGING